MEYAAYPSQLHLGVEAACQGALLRMECLQVSPPLWEEKQGCVFSRITCMHLLTSPEILAGHHTKPQAGPNGFQRKLPNSF